MQAALIAVYVVAIGLILIVPPSASTAIPKFAAVAHDYFGNVVPALSQVFRIRGLTLDGRLTGLLAFVYTYHYLNWFIKADLIRWNQMPRARLAAIALGCLAASGLYIYNFSLGFTVLLLLSLMHVLLEFPLNSRSIRELGQLAFGRGQAAPPPPSSSPRKGRGPYPPARAAPRSG